MGYPVRTEGVRKNVPGMRGQQSGVLAAGQGIYEQSDAPLHRLGDRIQLHGGRVFYYAYFDEAVVAGALVAPVIATNDLGRQTNLCVVSGNYSGAIGQKKIEITLATQTKNEYADATFHTIGDAGEGYTYLIKANSATGELLSLKDPALNATTSFMVELYDGLVVAVTAATEFCIQGNPFNNLDEATSTNKNVIGVSTRVMTADNYGWIQTWGPCTILAEATSGGIDAGDSLALDSGTAGYCILHTGVADYHKIGYALMTATDTEHAAVMLQIMP